jgi:hypothetical protein
VPVRSRSTAVAALTLTAALGSTLAAAPAAADKAFPTTTFPLAPVAGEPLRRGAVIDIHAQGPRVYALERYQLQGARPATTYQVALRLHTDAGCTQQLARVETAALTTNRAGNATGGWRFVPADVEGLEPGTYYIVWEVLRGDTVAYRTGCVPVPLD